MEDERGLAQAATDATAAKRAARVGSRALRAPRLRRRRRRGRARPPRRENLRQRRKARGMSLDDLARSSGVSRAALSQIETCKSEPDGRASSGRSRSASACPSRSSSARRAPGVDRPPARGRAGPALVRREAREPPAHPRRRLAPRRALRAAPLGARRPTRPSPRPGHPRGARRPQRRCSACTSATRPTSSAPATAIAFAADRPHSYENPAASEARYHNVIVYER